MEEEDQIKQVAIEFYKKLLGSSSLEFGKGKAERVTRLVQRRITRGQSIEMKKQVTKDEIRTLFGMKNKKVPSPDGYPAKFSRKLGHDQ